MEISLEKLEEFIALYRQEYGLDLTPAEALEQAIPLILLVQIVKN